jgi:fructosamine-3-kinase
MNDRLIIHFNNILDDIVTEVYPVSGGCINDCYKLETQKSNYFVKLNDTINLFEEENKGLDLLRASKTFFIPKIYKFGVFESSNFLLMEWIEEKNKSDNFWNFFAKNLSELHSTSNDKFGLDHDNYIGSLKQSNTYYYDGVEFFINTRLVPQLEKLNSLNNSSFFKKFDVLFNLLNEIIPVYQPSLLHGDLWSGNFLIDHNGHACIIDPAVYYGNREVDIAMTKLFGGFSEEFYSNYNNYLPMLNGWQERMPIWNLYPLLVHANLFGSSYLSQINSILNKYN